jgi:hypothetical protein
LKLRWENTPLPTPSDDAVRALQQCSSNSITDSSHGAPVLEGMMPVWNISLLRNDTVDNALSDNPGIADEDDDEFSSIVCEHRVVRELVHLCIMHLVSSINNVLLLRMPQPTPPLEIFGFVQVRTRIFLKYIPL